MPSNPLFILLFMVAAFIVASIILVPIFNKGNRSKINRVIKDVYDVDDDRDVSPQEQENIKNTKKNGEKK